MVETSSIRIEKALKSRLSEVNFNDLPFGRIFSDHMLVAHYDQGEWKSAKIQPYGPLQLPPAMSSLHYGQLIFEGMKAYRDVNGEINLFRPDENWKRFNRSAKRLVMPEVPEDIFLGGMKQLIELDKNWISEKEGYSLYIRPFMFAADEVVKVRPSDSYMFIIFTCPVGVYYNEPIKVKIEEEYIRSAEGGVGFAKCAGNYAGALFPTLLAQEQGYHQLLWTDAKNHSHLEESGTMNIMFVIDGKLITPPAGDTILPGITRKSVLHIAKDMGIEIEERQVSVQEVINGLENGSLQEAFGCGTAVTIGHINIIGYRGKNYELPSLDKRTISNSINERLNNIKTGKETAPEGWLVKI